jgi:aryl-alcohol dehydrogenase-like predicted oxidoreductase
MDKGKDEMIRKTELGNGLEVGAQGLGCMNLTGFYGRPFDEPVALATVKQALDLGITLLDTADEYGTVTQAGFGGNEKFVGKAIRGRRDEVVLVSKFGFVNPDEAVDDRKVRGDAAYVKASCDASLSRLGVDHIDLYFCHRLDPRVELEETIGAMADLVAAGKVRHIGLSAVSADSLRQAARVHPITALESEWSLWTRDIEYEVVPAARELGVGIMPYTPLGRGFLTGQLRSFDDLAPDDYRRQSPRFQGENFAKNLELVEHVKKLAESKGCTTPQLALAWLHAQGDFVVPIPGADRPEYVAENVGALDVQLSKNEVDAINDVFPLNAAAGARYTDMAHVSDAAPASATLS